MKIFEGYNKEGTLIYFEVPNLWLSRKSAIKVIKKIPGTEIIEEIIKEDVFCIFKMGDRIFEIMEPFGDNSRYHIGEKEAKKSNELEMIKKYFSAYKLGLFSVFNR